MTRTKIPSAIQLTTAELQHASGGPVVRFGPAIQQTRQSASGGVGKVSFQDLHVTT
jgi:hypothetical protein